MTSAELDRTSTERADTRWLALAVLSATQLMVILDGTVVNVALPTIQRDLGFTATGLAWVVNGFLVAFGGLLLFAGRVGDLFGPRRVFLAGVLVFTLASAWAGLAGSPELLVAARFAQGVGGALSSAVVLGMIARLYPTPGERTWAFGVLAFVGSAGASVGVVAGGVLVELADWHWIFLVNVPVGIAVLVAALRVLEPDPVRSAGHLDLAGALLVTVGLGLAVHAITQVPVHGWVSVRAGGLLGAAMLLLVAFGHRQLTAAEPLVPPALFRSRLFSVSNAVLFAMVVAGFSFQFLSALYLQEILGYGPLRTGLSYLAITFAIGIASLGFSARLAAGFGSVPVLVAGLALFVAGVLVMARFPVDGTYLADVLPPLLLMGAGFGLAMPQVTTLAMADADEAYAGVASGFFNTTQQVGGSIGLAVVSTVAANRTAHLVSGGAGNAVSLAGGYRAGFLVAAVVLTVGTVLAASLRRRA
jgi:EmrB/QacA subfamily drug resistance transporter